jgi:Protein of unknown function (DUF1553)/Protein of unknown function (DUF1549)/Bacterial Ig-like domain (group 2)
MRYFSLILVFLAVGSASAQSLRIDTGRPNATGFTLSGRDVWQQLQVTEIDKSGREHDRTREVKFEATPADIVAIDAAGLVTPRKEGTATIAATVAGKRATTLAKVERLVNDVPIHFANQVVPLFTKYGCNAGGCHGKASGQNGFKLSLLGFEPEDDYEYLVKENRGRRIMPAAPANSMLLLKATGTMPHGGGKRFDVDSPAYRVLYRWIEQGTPFGKPTDPVVTRIEVTPTERLLERDASQQLTVIAHRNDGSTVDVTRLSQFESNERDLAAADGAGLVTTKKLPGTFAVMARYQTHVAVFRGLVPLGVPVANLPPARNFVDELVGRRLKVLGLPPSPLCDDSTFLRRVTIDIAGRLPTLEETTAFLAETAPDRHEKLVDRLLGSGDYADNFAAKWGAVLRNRRQSAKDDIKVSVAFHDWIRDSLDKNVPLDQIVRGVLTAQGEAIKVPAVAWYREVKDVSAETEDVAQLWLGQRIACAKCHHHPFERWTTQDYWSLAAFFTRVAIKEPKAEKKLDNKKAGPPVPGNSWIVSMKPGRAETTHPRTKKTLKPAGLDGPELTLSADDDPRAKLADWIADPANPFFARTLVNRYWKHFLGRGLVEPEDDMRVTNPPTDPELLDALAKSFTDSKFDLKKLVRTICVSNTYRLSALPNEWNAGDRQNFSRFQPRRMPAEVLADAIDAVTLTKPAFKGVAAGLRAIQLPDTQVDSYFLSVFGRPDSSSACECERSGDSSLAQALHLYNSVELGKKTAGDRLKRLVADKRPVEERLGDLYLIALSRRPTSEELAGMKEYLENRTANVSAAYEDILWALVNTKEFRFNH